jgi:ubiquinone/menaquinone biosynthesis C-methylase UbiE
MREPEHGESASTLVGPSGELEERYYREENRILRDASHPGYIMPYLAPGESVLNLGCGSMTLDPPGNELYVGIDPFFDSLKERKGADPRDFCVQAMGEELPIRDRSFSVVMSRVAIMYMDVPRFTAEAYRVLEPGGRLWLTCHNFSQVAVHLALSVRRRNVKDVIFRSYVLFNGLLFHCFGAMVRFPFNRARIESFQTKRGLRRALERQGFTDIAFVLDPPRKRGFRRSLQRLRRLMRSQRLRDAAIRLVGWRHFLVTAGKARDQRRVSATRS